MRIAGLDVRLDDGHRLFHGLDLLVPRGQYVLVCGPTGSGKSTLALALTGQCRGQVDGVLQVGRVAAVWQDPGAQMCAQSLLEEVRLPMDYACVPARQGTRRARELLRAVGLDHLPEDRDPMRLSGGEQQRLALAAALAQEADVLVLDESTSQLDAAGRQLLSDALRRTTCGRTVLVIDHDPLPHLPLVDRVLVLDQQGRIVRDGPTLPTDALELGIRVPGAPLDPDGDDVPETAGSARVAGAAGWDSPMELGTLGIFPKGAVVALTGPNGAGKSTFLRNLTRNRQLVQQGVTWLPQRGLNHLLADTVLDELGGDTSQARHWVRLADLEGLESRRPLALSGGQRQRLALASALTSHRARLALLDEPSYSQDLRGVRSVVHLIEQGAHQRVTLMASHDEALVERLATHRARLLQGRVTEVERL